MQKHLDVQRVLRLAARAHGETCVIEVEDEQGHAQEVRLRTAMLELLMLPLSQLLDQTRSMTGESADADLLATGANVHWETDGNVAIDIDFWGGYRERIRMSQDGAAALARAISERRGNKYILLKRHSEEH
jgi:hypothetical protein